MKHFVQTRVTKALMKLVRDHADADGMSVAAWTRKVIAEAVVGVDRGLLLDDIDVRLVRITARMDEIEVLVRDRIGAMPPSSPRTQHMFTENAVGLCLNCGRHKNHEDHLR